MSFINSKEIEAVLDIKRPEDASRTRDILAKARELKGLSSKEALTLLDLRSPDLKSELFETARWVKDEIYGNRLVFFAPLYVSNICKNDCAYCAFNSTNRTLKRRALTQAEIKQEVTVLLEQGHKRILLVAGESYPDGSLDYVFKAIDNIYAVKRPVGNIRRVNVNIAPLTVDEFRELDKHRIGTYQLFQETYHEESYRKLHRSGPKKDYLYRLMTMDRALEGGIHDVGIGLLFGLYDWRYEIQALLAHVRHLEETYGIGPHTISVPRLEPADGSDLSRTPPHPVSDDNFKKIIAVLRLAVPYTGLILSTRESAEMRRQAFEIGISQISAGSRTDPGGYGGGIIAGGQFSLGDMRTLGEVIADVVAKGFIPSFCTGCYRRGRVGKDFMDLARPGLIKNHCLPNAILTFAEYLQDFAVDKNSGLSKEGYKLIHRLSAEKITNKGLLAEVRHRLDRILQGERDLYF